MVQLFVTLLLFFGTGVIGILYLGPEWTRFGGLRREAEGLQAVSAKMDDLFLIRDELFRKVNAVSNDDLELLESALPGIPARAPFLASLEALAISKGLILKNLDTIGFITQQAAPSLPAGGPRQPAPRTGGAPRSAVSKGALGEVEVQMIVLGFYDQFKQFLDALEKSVRIIDAKQLSFGSVGAEKGSAVPLEFKILMKTYYQP